MACRLLVVGTSMTELYGWKPTNSAKVYLDEIARREAFDRERERLNQRRLASQQWLDDYHAKPQPTRFNWSPRIPYTITKENTDAQEAEAAFVSTSQEAAEVDLREGMGDAAPASAVDSGERSDTQRDGGRRPECAAHDWLNDPIPF